MLLSEVATPTIRDVIGGRLHGDAERHAADDLIQDVLLQLTLRLRRLRVRGPADGPIDHLRGYVAVVSLRECDRFVRNRFPERNRLRKRIRYVLSHHPACAIEPSHRGMACQLLTSAPAGAGHPARRLQDLAESPDLSPALARRDPARMALSDLIVAMLEWAGGPVTLEDLTSAVAHLAGVRDRRPLSADVTEAGRDSPILRSGATSHAEQAEAWSYLKWLWAEIRELPSRQRAALLLNLRDDGGASVLPLLVLTGIATPGTLASVLELTEADLRGLWPQLPADDATIAARIGITRQQVINLRKAARLRLLRRSRRAGLHDAADRAQPAAIRAGARASAS